MRLGALEKWEPLIFLILQVGLMLGALALQREPVIIPNDPETITYLSPLANKLQLAGIDPFAALLFASNVGSMSYGLWFYAVRRKGGNGLLSWITLLYFVTLAIASIYATVYGNVPAKDAEKLGANIQYFGSVAITVYFFVVDFFSYKYFAKNDDDSTIMAFSSMYISVPCLLALGFTWLVHQVLIGSGIAEEASIAFLAGASAVLLVLSNLIFAAVLHPIYMKNLRLTLERKASAQNPVAQVAS